MSFKEATSVAVDSRDRVYVFNRGNWPVMIFDADGNFLETWGAGEFDRPHGIFIDGEDNLFMSDDDGHFVDKRTPSGEVIFRLGERGRPAAWQEGAPFNRPTDIVVHPKSGDIFISDGYGNSRVHKFDSEGNHIKSWGDPGWMDGQFSLPHNICLLGDDKLIVADRENFRIQLFTLDGEYVGQKHMHRPIACGNSSTGDGLIFVAEAGAPAVQKGVRNLGNCVVVFDADLNEVDRFGGDLPGERHDQFIAPHGIATDSTGAVYIAEVSYTNTGSNLNPPREVASLRKWAAV
jgi:sugar lactone lactonase YvrE